MTKDNVAEDSPVIIKKYANRRLYNTSSSSYITLDDLAKMTREGIEFLVLDAKTGNDITHSILTQIIMDEEANGEQMLPLSFLRQLISMYGNSMQSMMPQYLEASMTNFYANQKKLQQAFSENVGENPLAKLAQTNMAMFKAATQALMPNDKVEAEGDTTGEPNELDILRQQMAEMQEKLSKMGK